MAKNIKEVFDEGCPDLKVDREFIKKLHQYAQAFANKNDDHIAFFGGTLMGVHPVRFRTEDRNRWFDDILQADDLAIEEELHKLPAIVPSRQVSSDVMNLSCLWLTHRIYTSPHLSQKEKEDAMVDAILVLQYKFITSILAHWFRYPADEAVATATYAALSKKFGLKVHGSWRALLLARTHDILAKGTIHYRTYTNFNDDLAVVYMVNDIQGRIKDILKNIRDVFETVSKDPKGLIRSTSATVTLDGVTKVRDKQRNFIIYRRYLHEVITDKETFIRDELVDIVASAMNAMPRRHLVEALTYMAQNSGKLPSGTKVSQTHRLADPRIDKLIDETLTHAFAELTTNRTTNTSDIGGLVARMRSLYMASRGSDPTLLEMRSLAEGIAADGISSRNGSVIAAVRTGILLYIVLRTFTRNHYAK